jgi:protein-tyrosine kinase
MSRIQQILSKAERDGTARRMGSPETRQDYEVGSAPYTPGTSFDAGVAAGAAVAEPIDSPPDTTRHEFGVVDDAPAQDPSSVSDGSSDGSRVSVEAILSPLLVAALDPLSPAAEQYRSLRSRIARAESAQPLRVIQITSPGKDEGKTVTAVNLTLTMAQEFQRRVLVIDTDLRRPGVHELLGLPPGPGLVDVLTGSATLDEALVEIPQYHLTVLRAGRTYDRPAEMLGSAPMRRLVDTLRTHFDRIVVDSAPATVADPGAVATLVDGLVLVVRAGSTTKPAIARAIQTLGATKLLGLVFNASSSTQQTQYAASA